MNASLPERHACEEALASATSTRPTRFQRTVLWLTLCTFVAQPIAASAQVISAASGSHQPRVDSAANGVPVVQITTPSAAGVSHNQYQQYSVTPQGVILNNSPGIVQTQQAGYIDGNPNLSAGAARIILNEVISNLPSNLRGYTEVGGAKAEVIIANPNGITCDGCGFINTSRGVLTTGTPVFGASGSLDAFRVVGGNIAINGAGLNASNTDQVDLIARAVQVNAALWGNTLNVITGANQVAYAGLGTQVIAGSGAQPSVSIDVALLGGMYANKIRLVGTEAGVGVVSAGTLAAQAGDLSIDSVGNITLTGSTRASGNVSANSAGSITNSGTVYAQGSALLNAGNQLTNSGTVAAQGNTTLNGNTANNSGVIGAGIDATGHVLAGAGDLSFSAILDLTSSGTLMAGGRLALTGSSLHLAGGFNQANHVSYTATAGDIDHRGAQTLADQDVVLSTGGTLDNHAGQIDAGTTLSATAFALDNTSGHIGAGQHLGLNTTTLINRGGTLYSAQDALLSASQSVDNSAAGRIEAGTSLTVTAPALDNTTGRLRAGTSLSLTSATLGNQGGMLYAVQDATLNVSQRIDNSAAGTIEAGTALSITAPVVDNSAGHLWAGQNLWLTATTLTNPGGTLYAGQDARLAISGTLDNSAAAQIETGGNLTVTAGTLNNATGRLWAGQDMSLTASRLANSGGTLYAARDAYLTADQYTGDGILLAERDLSIQLNGAYTQSASNLIQANRDLSFMLTGDLINQGTLSAVRSLTVSAANIDNQSSGTLQGATANLTARQAFNNAGAILANIQNLQADSLTNTGSVFGQDLTVTANTLTNSGNGVIAAGNSLNLYIANTLSNLDGALLYSGGDLAIAGSAHRDSNGWLDTATGHVLNRSADIEAGRDLEITATTLDNQRTSAVTANRVLATTTILAQEKDGNWGASVGSTYLNSNSVNISTTIQTCDMQGKNCTSSTSSQSNGIGFFGSSPTLGTVTSGPVTDCSDPAACYLVTTTTTTTLGPTYGTGDWGPAAASVPTFTMRNDADQVPYERRRVIVSEQRQDYVVSATAEARLLAGRDIYLRAGTVNNTASRIEATNNLLAQVTTLNNVGYTLNNSTHDTTWHGSCTDIQGDRAGLLGSCNSGWIWSAAVSDTLTGTNTSLDAVFRGGQTLSLSAVTVNNRTVDAQGLPPGGVSLSGHAAPGAGTPYVFASPGNGTGTFGSGLYTVNTAPNARYLVETDPRFTQYANFISSDYMLSRLGLNPALVEKRLGDGYYEQQLVREQIINRRGQASLGQYASLDAEYQSLLDAGVAYAQAFAILPGVTLTKEQVAGLAHDMVWLEERIVDGQRVLVPVVYFAQTSDTGKVTGALIGGGVTTRISAVDINNSGTIAASGETTLSASHDLNNDSGRISGQTVALGAGNDLHLGIATQKLTLFPGQTFTREGVAGSVDGQSVTLAAGRDLTLAGGQIQAGDATLSAGRDLSIGTQTVTTEQHLKNGGSTYDRSASSERASTISTTGDLSLSAQNDLTVAGSQVKSGGNLTGTAGNNILLNAATASESVDYGGHGKAVNATSQSQSATAQTSTLEAGKSLTLSAGNALYSEGATLRAKEDIALTASTIVLDAAHDQASRSDSYSNVGTRGVQQDQSQRSSDTATGTIVDAGRNLSVTSRGNTTVVGGALAAGQDLKLQTGGDLALLAAQSSRSTDINAFSQGSKKATTLTYSEQEARQLLTTITVGNNADLQVGGNFTADVGETNVNGKLNADRMTTGGVVRGDSRQQVSVTQTGEGAQSNPTSSQVLGDLKTQGVRNGSNDSFAPNASQTGNAALQQYLASGLLQIKSNPQLASQLSAILKNSEGSTLTYKDDSGKLSLTVAGQAKVQEVFNTLKLSETFDTKKFADQQTAMIVTLIVAIVLTVCTAGAGAASIGAVMAGANTLGAAMINAAVVAMASTMTGQLTGGASFDKAFEAGVKAAVISAASAGVTYGVDQYVNGANTASTATSTTTTAPSTVQTGGEVVQSGTNGAGNGLSNLDRLSTAAYWEQTALNATAQGALAKLQGGSFQDGFTGSVVGSLAASGAGIIGDYTSGDTLSNIAAHAVLGCASAAANRKDCASGAIGGAASASLARIIDGAIADADLSQTTKNGIIAGGAVSGSMVIAAATGNDVLTAGNAASNEVMNNSLSHLQATRLTDKVQACAGAPQCINDAVYNAILLSNRQGSSIDQANAQSAVQVLAQLAGDPTMPLTDANRQAIAILAGKNVTDYIPAGAVSDTQPKMAWTSNGNVPITNGGNSVGNACISAECIPVGIPGGGPDYLSVQGSLYVASGGFSLNLHNGETTGQWGLGRAYPYNSLKPGVTATIGNILGGADAQTTSEFLHGGAGTASYFYPLPVAPVVGIGGGVNYSYGGKVSVETGISVPPGAGAAPFNYGFDLSKKEK